MQIKLIATERDSAEKLMLPIQNQVISLTTNGSDVGSIEWGDVEVERGAIETIFEIIGSLHLESVAVGVAVEIIANWLWSFLQKPNDIQVKVLVVHDDASKITHLETESADAMKASLSVALDKQSNKS